MWLCRAGPWNHFIDSYVLLKCSESCIIFVLCIYIYSSPRKDLVLAQILCYGNKFALLWLSYTILRQKTRTTTSVFQISFCFLCCNCKVKLSLSNASFSILSHKKYRTIVYNHYVLCMYMYVSIGRKLFCWSWKFNLHLASMIWLSEFLVEKRIPQAIKSIFNFIWCFDV